MSAPALPAPMPLGEYYWRLLWSRRQLVAAIVAACTLAALAFSTLVLADDPTYESAARLNIVPTAEELGYASRFVRGSTFDGGSVLLQTYAEYAHTRPVVAPIVDRYITESAQAAGQDRATWIAANSIPNPFAPRRIVALLNYGATPPLPLREDLIEALVEHTIIESVEGTYLIRLAVEWDDPQSAAWFANALSDAIIARARDASRGSGAEIAGSLSARLAAKQAELAGILRRSRATKTALGVVDIDRQKQSLLEAQLTEQSQLTSDRAQLSASRSQVAALRAQTGGKLSSAQPALEQALAIEAPKASGLQQGIAIREGRVGQIAGQLAAIGRSETQVKALDDAAAALQAEVTALTERIGFSETENAVGGPRIELIERAVPPVVRSSPKTLFNTALGFVAGCALAGCALLLLGPAAPKLREEDAAPAADPLDAPSFAELPDPPTPPRGPARPAPTQASAPAFTPGIVRTAPLGGTTALARVENAQPARLEPPEPPVRAEPIVRIVPPAPRPEPAGIAPRIFADPLDEARAKPLADWLGAAFASPCPLLVAGSDQDAEAQALYRLIYTRLQAAGIPVRTLDATIRDARPAEDGRKPLLYAGGFGQSGDSAMLARLDPAVEVVVAVPVRHRDGADQLCAAAHRQCAALLGRAAHIVAVRV